VERPALIGNLLGEKDFSFVARDLQRSEEFLPGFLPHERRNKRWVSEISEEAVNYEQKELSLFRRWSRRFDLEIRQTRENRDRAQFRRPSSPQGNFFKEIVKFTTAHFLAEGEAEPSFLQSTQNRACWH
jgi:hypothetical protein